MRFSAARSTRNQIYRMQKCVHHSQHLVRVQLTPGHGLILQNILPDILHRSRINHRPGRPPQNILCQNGLSLIQLLRITNTKTVELLNPIFVILLKHRNKIRCVHQIGLQILLIHLIKHPTHIPGIIQTKRCIAPIFQNTAHAISNRSRLSNSRIRRNPVLQSKSIHDRKPAGPSFFNIEQYPIKITLQFGYGFLTIFIIDILRLFRLEP